MANADCESIDAYLVEIQSFEENEWILANIVHQHFHSSQKGNMMRTVELETYNHLFFP